MCARTLSSMSSGSNLECCSTTRAHVLALSLGALALGVCGGDEGPEPAKQADPHGGAKFDDPLPKATAETAPPDLPAEPPEEDDWGREEEGGAADEGQVADTEGGDDDGSAVVEAPPGPHPGPCTVRWSGGGPVLRFTWVEGGGRVRVDQDADGKSDVCGRFEAKDGKTTKVWVDDGCDRKTDIEILPTYEEGVNLATARYALESGGQKTTREITLVTMPSFTGLDPGYPLWAAKADIAIKTSKGLVKSAHVKQPLEGPPTKLTFRYDKDGRVTQVKEDLEADGSTDRRFDYRYDEEGNVSRMSYVITVDGEEKKGTARIDYKCWEKAEEKPEEKAAESAQ